MRTLVFLLFLPAAFAQSDDLFKTISMLDKALFDAYNTCGKVHRDLVPGTLKVYPLKGYGAVETGIHLFCDPKMGKCGDGSGVGRFTMLWEFRGGVWMVTRVISYDHCNRCSLASAPPNFRK